MVSQAYGSLNRSWKATCRILLGDEVGELRDYEGWLAEHRHPMLKRKSAASGGDVFCAVADYDESADFIALDEVGREGKFEPLGINEIKDIDSVIGALKERFQYCGNIVLGSSGHVENSSDVQNSFYVLGSNFIYDCEEVAYSSYCRGSKHLFAVVSDYGSSHLVRCFETHRQSRCLEAWNCYNSSDCYYSCHVEGSQDALFSFNQRNKRNIIGNLELSRDRYMALKAKLVAELREELEERRRLPSLMEMASASAKPAEFGGIVIPGEPDEAGDMAPIEDAFRRTTGVVLGRPLEGIESYAEWLGRHVPGVEERRSAASGKTMFVAGQTPCTLYPADRLVDRDEFLQIGRMTRLDEWEIGSLESLKKAVGRIALVNPNGRLGECRNVMRAPLCNTSVDVFNCPIASFNKGAAFCYWPRHSEYVFGSALAFSSSFCIDCYYSMNLSRAFETDGSSNCSDAYFVHNCENARDCMFCFNSKNLRFAIGNAQMPPDEYRKAKGTLLGQIADELERTGMLKWDIYGIGRKSP